MMKPMRMPWDTLVATATVATTSERASPKVTGAKPAKSNKRSVKSKLKRLSSLFHWQPSRLKINIPRRSTRKNPNRNDGYQTLDTSSCSSTSADVKSQTVSDDAPASSYTPHRLRCDSISPEQTGHSLGLHSKTSVPEPNTVPYSGPTHFASTDPETVRRLAKLSRTCPSCGMQHWQCANADNNFGTDFNRVPAFRFEVEDIDSRRLTDYVRRRTKSIPYENLEERVFVGLYLMDRSVGSKGKTPIEVRVALEKRQCKKDGKGKTLVLRLCDAKRVQVAHRFAEHVERVKGGGVAKVYLVDERQSTMFGVLMMK
ncbi:hypothetical protein P280DRAFT_131907 [Massarina eburnea CBS 473.64]|uniref:Uncharacterized protein n=1 Tax=Massarina eburnea CBS 473.64 TaxID=1395130 RepID=A0A6A6SI47_9PLEO|nr:hypothetical protein P280DRAFT_131907 [Massarina eburnea CBS 473.64]